MFVFSVTMTKEGQYWLDHQNLNYKSFKMCIPQIKLRYFTNFGIKTTVHSQFTYSALMDILGLEDTQMVDGSKTILRSKLICKYA